MEDGMQKDGLVDVYNQVAMGVCADTCAKEYHFFLEDQDAYAIQSYKRATSAWSAGKIFREIVLLLKFHKRRGSDIVYRR